MFPMQWPETSGTITRMTEPNRNTRAKKLLNHVFGPPPPLTEEQLAARTAQEPVHGLMNHIFGPPPPLPEPVQRPGDEQIRCPHCTVVGQVVTREEKAKKGVSGGKATAAVLTAGVSLVGTGLSRKELVTLAKCGNCNVRWTIT